MTGQTAAERATALLDLHSPGDPVVLPTVWDAWSARLATDAGFAALTVGSHLSFSGADSPLQTGRRGHDPETAALPQSAATSTRSWLPTRTTLGVARISFGPFFQAALATRANELLARWG